MAELIKWNPKKELFLVAGTLLWLWFAYYGMRHFYADNVLLLAVLWVLATTIVVCVFFPSWWIVKKQKEGFAGLGITKHRLLLSVVFTLGLSVWRGISLIRYIDNSMFAMTLVIIGLTLWEVFFIFSWMFTRYEASFGKIPAVVLTAMSTVLYHVGSLNTDWLCYLFVTIVILSCCFAVTKNIFTLWPVYWMIGVSESAFRYDQVGSSGPNELLYFIAVAFTFIVHIGWFVFLKLTGRRKASGSG